MHYNKISRILSFSLAILLSTLSLFPTLNVTASEKNEENISRVYVANTPIRLQINKIKEETDKETGERKITYKTSGRIDGDKDSLINIYGINNLEFAYNSSGKYMGFAWKKGTLENLTTRKNNENINKEKVDIIYIDGVFQGYALIEKTLDTADDINRYVSGATMTLYEGIELFHSGNTEDFSFDGLNIIRDTSGNITRMYVEKGYAGSKIEYVLDKTNNNTDNDINNYSYDDAINDTGDGTWIAKTIQREDTDILYFDLQEVDSLTKDSLGYTHGYDINGNDKIITDDTTNIYVKQFGQVKFEFEDSAENLRAIKYTDGKFIIKKNTVMYHLDSEGIRDAKVDPYTGMAYLTEDIKDINSIDDPTLVPVYNANDNKKIFVWPVNIVYSEGNVITKEKIKTSRIAEINEDSENAYTVGTLDENGFNHYQNPTIDNNGLPIYYQKANGGFVKTDNGEYIFNGTNFVKGDFYRKTLNPNYDEYVKDGRGSYINNNGIYEIYTGLRYDYSEGYIKGTPIYDRDSNFVYYNYDDNLNNFNEDAYSVQNKNDLLNIGNDSSSSSDDNILYHRQGENYILENTWITGDKFPNDPFKTDIDYASNDPYYQSDNGGEADILKRVYPNLYIMEELNAPDGYVKAMPVAVTVTENTDIQISEMVDKTTKLEITKEDASDKYKIDVIDRDDNDKILGQITEPKIGYSFDFVSGATLGIYPAHKIATNDYSKYPKGYYLEKDSNDTYIDEYWSNNNTFDIVDGKYIKTKDKNIYIENLPVGCYIIDEIKAPEGSGLIRTSEEIEIKENGDLQFITINDDHTKIEINKYYIDEDGNRKNLPVGQSAGLTLYAAKLDSNGNVMTDNNNNPIYDANKVIDTWNTDDVKGYKEFKDAFESGLNSNNAQPNNVNTINWTFKEKAVREASSFVWVTDRNQRVIVENGLATFPVNMTENEKTAFLNAYNTSNGASEFNYDVAMNATKDTLNSELIGSETGVSRVFKQIWNVSDGTDILVGIQKNLGINGFEYLFEYKFNYKFLNNKMNSYTTETGNHRIDYIPIDIKNNNNEYSGKYVLVETKTPEGFQTANPKLIDVKETSSVQVFNLENKYRSLTVIKTGGSKENNLYFGYAGTDENGIATLKSVNPSNVTSDNLVSNNEGLKGIPNAIMALYKADANGSFVMDENHLIESWTSEEYTANDEVKGNILSGYKVGDIKPHSIKKVSYGTYYLVETLTPSGYKTINPIKLEITKDSAELLTVLNEVNKGQVEILKTDKDTNAPLKDAQFKIVNVTTNEIVDIITTNVSGKAISKELPVGKITNNGTVIPYTYRLQEIAPPSAHQISSSPIVFTFNLDTHDKVDIKSFTTNNSITNEETKIAVNKKNFDNYEPVIGAEMSVYEAINNNGEYTLSNALDTWTTTTNDYIITGKLSAGKTYCLKETKAPTGYSLSKPVYFTLSDDGRRVNYITEDKNLYSVLAIEDPKSIGYDNENNIENKNDIIKGLTVTGRNVKVIDYELTDSNNNIISSWTSLDNKSVLNSSDGLQNGKDYTLSEYIVYTDSGNKKDNRYKFSSTTFQYQNSDISIISNDGSNNLVKMQLLDSNNNLIDEWNVSNNKDAGYSHTILNPINIDLNDLKVISDNGFNGAAAKAGSILKYEFTYNNLSENISDISISASLDSDLTFLGTEDTNGNFAENNSNSSLCVLDKTAAFNGNPSWLIKNVPVGASGKLVMYASIKKNTIKNAVSVNALIDSKSYSSLNPIARNNTLTLINKVKASDMVPFSNRTFDYDITFTTLDGKPLVGRYDYTGSYSGQFSGSNAHISLKANEYIIIDMANTNVKYEITRTIPADIDLTKATEDVISGDIKNGFNTALFSCYKVDMTDTLTFKENETYTLVEFTTLGSLLNKDLDTDTYITNKTSFTIDENQNITSLTYLDKVTSVSFSKKDITTGEEIPGTHISIYDKHGNLIEEWTSTDKPHIITGKLNYGEEYTMVETGAPNGYSYTEDIKFTVNSDGTIDKIIMHDTKTNLEITKSDITTGKDLPGATLQIKDNKGNVIVEWITGETPVNIIGKVNADETYYLHEEIAAPGYAYANDIMFKVNHDKTITKVEMKDKPTKVVLSKTDITNGKELPGATIIIKDENGNIIDKWVSTDKPHEITGVLEAGKEYTMIEEKAPNGYGYSEDIKFKVSLDGTVDYVYMKDDTTKASIYKTTVNTTISSDGEITSGKILGGAHLQIKDSNNQVIEEWDSIEDTPHYLEKVLNADDIYTLVETKAPAGYAIAKNITFTVDRFGKNTLIQMIDKVPSSEYSHPIITITKYDANLHTTVSGADYEIYKPDGSVYMKLTTNDNGYITFNQPQAGTYTYREVKAPEGYMIDLNTYSFTINSNGTVSGTLAVTDSKAPEVIIKKKDLKTKENLSGALLQVIDSEGNVRLEDTTDENGEIIFYPKWKDTYTIEEIEAPNGYNLNSSSIKFHVDEEGRISGSTVIYDTKIEDKVGTVTAKYDNEINGSGKYYIDENGELHLIKTGDDFNPYIALIISLLSIFGSIILLLYVTKKKKTK